jgi:transketolase
MVDKLRERILQISLDNKLSHVGSCLTSLPIIYEIYLKKRPEEKFINSSGHSHLAHAVVMENFNIIKDAEENIKEYGIHCEKSGGCDCSTGSLGMGLPIALGMALSDRKSQVYCLISDGECAEGSIWESLRIAQEQKVSNLHIYVNCNGYGAYRKIDTVDLCSKLMQFSYWYEKNGKFERNITPVFTASDQFMIDNKQNAHYKTLTQEEYEKII